MSAHVHLHGADLGRIETWAEADRNGHINLYLRGGSATASVLMDRAEAAKIMADLATAMGLIEAPKVAA